MSNPGHEYVSGDGQTATAQFAQPNLNHRDSFPVSLSTGLTKTELTPSHGRTSSLPIYSLSTDEHPSFQIDAGQGFVARQRSDSDVTAEIVTATAVFTPQRLSVQPTSIRSSTLYPAYAHGAPLSDIGEEEVETDPITTRPRKINKSRTPSPPVDSVLPLQNPRLKNKAGQGNMSSSSGGSDSGIWEDFDTSKLGSGRVAADIAQARESLDLDDVRSKRNSRELDDELAALNDRAEKILENARKRLTHMEDNLTKARHSMLLTSTRSTPNMQDVTANHKPAGGLYRSISQNTHKRRGGFPVKPNGTTSHTRTGSDNVVPSGTKRLSKVPDVRPASALGFSKHGGVVTPEKKLQHSSPGSSRSFNSPLRILAEEPNGGTPSTVTTSPGLTSQDSGPYQGLGIYSTSIEISEARDQSTRGNSEMPHSMDRSNSSASTRSAKDLTGKISEMRSRITELKIKAQADSLRRRSMQSLRNEGSVGGHSPSTSISIDRWQSSSPDQPQVSHAPIYDVNPAPAWRLSSQSSHQRQDSQIPDKREVPISEEPVTPVTKTFLTTDITPKALASARTDRNTPNLVTRIRKGEDGTIIDDSDVVSVEQPSYYKDVPQIVGDEHAESEIAANEEEQIYLNEVLEESLQEAEPEVPIIPAQYILDDIAGEEGLSHEDRLDAFDYENMFLHSAMGSYMGKTESEDGSDNESIETSRQGVQTPTLELDDDEHLLENQEGETSQDSEEIDTDEEMEAEMMLHQQSPPQSQIRSTLAINLNEANKSQAQALRMPWAKVARSNSMESASSTATFQTATEGADMPDHGMPEDIINWGNPPVEGQRVYIQPKSPIRAVHIVNHRRHPSSNGSASRLASGSDVSKSPSSSVFSATSIGNTGSPIATSPRPRSASGQYRIFPTSTSTSHNQQPRRQLKGHTRTSSSSSSIKQSQQLTPPNSSSPASATISAKPKTTSIHHRSSISPAEPPTQSLPNPTQPAIQSLHHNNQHTRSISSSQFSVTTTGSDTSSILATSHANTATAAANTTILMESLIKLADPSFALGPTTRFEDLDKELVLGLLRAVGAVGSEILRSQDEGHHRQVGELRGRLGRATEVLIHGVGPNGGNANGNVNVTGRTSNEGRALDSGLGFDTHSSSLAQRRSN